MRFLIILILIILFCSNNSLSQITIQGSVKDTLNKSIAGATITLVLKETKSTIAYTYSDELGNFNLVVQDKFINSQCILSVSSLGFRTKEKLISISNTLNTTNHFILTISSEKLSEVIVQTKPPITTKKDTINYNVESYISNYDRSIGDVLQKLPGIEVTSSGIIKYQGKPINKFYIEGKDLLSGRYNIATTNVPADAVEKVQVLENHQPIKLLDSFTTSNNAAINLVLKDKARNKIIGKAKLGIGYPFISTDNEIVPLFFANNYQSIATIKYNNIGKDYAKELAYLYNDDYNDIIFSNKYFGEIVYLNMPSVSGIDLDKFYNNNQLSTSINQLTLTKNNNELKGFIDFVYDNKTVNGSNATTYYFANDTIKITELNNYFKKENTVKANLQYIANKSNYLFANYASFQFSQNNANTNIFNPIEIYQKTKYQRVEFLNTSKYSFRKKKHVFEFSLIAGFKKDPQQLFIEHVNYDTFFTKTPNPAFLVQDIHLKSLFTSLNASWYLKTNSNFSFSNNFSFNYFHHLFNSLLNAGNKDSLFTVKAGFNNNATFNHYVITNNWAINYKLPKLSFTVSIPYSFYKIISHQPYLPTSFFDKHFLGVNVLVNYRFHKKWSLSTSVSNQLRISPSFISSSQYILYNYRSLNNNNSMYPYNKNFSIDNFINYKNVLKYTFITLNHKYQQGIYNPIMDNEFHQILHIRKANNGNTYRQTNSIMFAYSQYLPKLKTTAKAQLFLKTLYLIITQIKY
jgi:hypothetical protein